MKRTILVSALLAGFGLGASLLPASALPVSAAGVTATAGSDVVEARMQRRSSRRMRRHMRQGSASRGNSSMPSRRGGAKQYGQTTSGPRR